MYHKKTVAFVNLVLGVTQRPVTVTDEIVPVPASRVVVAAAVPVLRTVCDRLRASTSRVLRFEPRSTYLIQQAAC
jgi:hypothetical protein